MRGYEVLMIAMLGLIAVAYCTRAEAADINWKLPSDVTIDYLEWSDAFQVDENRNRILFGKGTTHPNGRWYCGIGRNDYLSFQREVITLEGGEERVLWNVLCHGKWVKGMVSTLNLPANVEAVQASLSFNGPWEGDPTWSNIVYVPEPNLPLGIIVGVGAIVVVAAGVLTWKRVVTWH